MNHHKCRVLAALCAGLMLLSACSEGTDCRHQFLSETVSESTCSTQGLLRKTCHKCGHTTEEKLPKNDKHTFVSQTTKAATCTQAGTKIDVCTLCAATEEGTLPIAEHTYVEKLTQAPSCTKAGTKTFTCTVCAHQKTENVPAVGHQWQDYTCLAPTTCATCKLTEGDKGPHSTLQGTCAVCGKELTELVDTVVPALEAAEPLLTSARSYSERYSTNYAAEANAFYMTKAFEQTYSAIAEVSYLCNALAGMPAHKGSYEQFFAIYTLHTHFEDSTVTTDNLAQKYKLFTTHFPKLLSAFSAGKAALEKECAAAGINITELYTPLEQ